MATIIGNKGSVKISTSQVAEVLNFSLTQNANTADDTVLQDVWDSHKAGTFNWSGSVNCYYDKSDATGQGVMTVGADVELHLIPDEAIAGNIDFNGQATITSIEQSTANNSIVTANFSFTGNGILNETTIV